MTASSRFPHPAPAASRRPLGVLGFALVGLLGAYSLFWAAVSFPSLNALAAAHSMTAPPVLAVTVMLGPAMFWAFIGLGLSRTGWAAGLTLTTILIVLTYASLTAQSHGHGFSYWLFLTLLVICSLVAFCLIPNILVQLAVGRR
ncbi:hypothetical protein [Streptomyces nitrosporeus]|uniref:hypothetical protein n=1 Tax=Streptomyces nitrosporeus TaxID=28894 RepID=UPI0039A1A4CA